MARDPLHFPEDLIGKVVVDLLVNEPEIEQECLRG